MVEWVGFNFQCLISAFVRVHSRYTLPSEAIFNVRIFKLKILILRERYYNVADHLTEIPP